MHQIFGLQQLFDRQQAAGQLLNVCFLDLRGAYDRVSRPVLWQVLQRLGIHGRMLAAVQSLYATAEVAVKVGGRTGLRRRSLTGVKQGCPLSPTLFGLFADGLHRALLAACAAAGIQLSGGDPVTDLGYADDLALVSPSAAGLQRLIDAAATFCQSVGMEVSCEKTKVLVAGGHGQEAGSWSCGDAALEQVQQYKYLGLLFTSQAGFQQTIPRLKSKMWGAWATIKRQYGNLQCAESLWLLLRLYNVCVVPTASYGCELWGHYPLRGADLRSRRDLKNCHLQLMRIICGLRQSVASAIVFEELGASPIDHGWLLRAVGFWNNLAAMPDGCLHKRLALDACRAAICHNIRNWAWGVYYACKDIGYALSIRVNGMDKIDIASLRSKLSASMRADWQNLDVCPRTCVSRGARLCTYLRWFARPAGERRSYLKVLVSAGRMRRFLRFRVGCHGLPRDIGSRHGTDRLSRVCSACDTGEIGDERHLLFECPALQRFRNMHPHLFVVPHQTVQQFIWQRDLYHVIIFVTDCLEYLREPDPLEGSGA